MKLKCLRIGNYRSLVEVNLNLRDLTVVIGPNGAGKTALLEILQLLQRGGEKELASFLEEQGGFRAVLCHHGRGAHQNQH